MSKKAIRKIIEQMEKSGKMKNVVFARRVRKGQEGILYNLMDADDIFLGFVRELKQGDYVRVIGEIAMELPHLPSNILNSIKMFAKDLQEIESNGKRIKDEISKAINEEESRTE